MICSDVWIVSSYSLSPENTLKHLKHMEDLYCTDILRVHCAQERSLSKEKIMTQNPINVPIWEKTTLTLEEAATYSGIGINKLRDVTNEKNCRFVLWVGSKRLIKRKLFEQFIEESFSI